MANDILIGSAEACEILGVHRATLIRWTEQDKLTPVHRNPGLTGAYVFRRADVERLRDELADRRAS